MHYCKKCLQTSLFDLAEGECQECLDVRQIERDKFLPALYQLFYEKMCELTYISYCPTTIQYHEADFLVTLHKYYEEGIIKQSELQEFMETYINATNHLKNH